MIPFFLQELPGAKKFRKAGMKNLDHLRVMFDDIASNGVDHTPVPATSSPSTPESPVNVANLDGLDNGMEDNDDTQLEEESPSNRNKKRPRHANNANKNKSSRTEIALLMQAQLKGMADLAEKAQATFENFTSLVGSLGSSIQYVMTLVQECGARSGSDEHFIATELFVSREQREMFLTLSTAEERLEWLRRKYKAKYGA